MNLITYQLVRVMFPSYVREVESIMWDYESAIEEWQDYTEQLKDQIRQYTPTIVDYKIAKKLVPSVNLGKVNMSKSAIDSKTGKARSEHNKNSYAMVLPGMPEIPEGYDPEFTPISENGLTGGALTFVKSAVVKPVNPVVAKNGSKAEDSKASDNGKDNLNKNDQEWLKTNLFYELVDLIMDDRKVKKLPKDQFDWLKDKYPAWSKNPASNEEYKKRFDGKFSK